MKQVTLSFSLTLLLIALGNFILQNSHPSQAQPSQTASTPCCGEPIEDKPRQINFPYYSVRDGYNSVLQLVSASPKPLDFAVTIHSRSGQPLVAPTAIIQPQEKRAIDILGLLNSQGADAAGDFAEGSVAVNFHGTIMPLAGQLTITNLGQRMSFESEMVENDPGYSDIPQTLDAIWWGLGGGRDAKIMVSNTSNQTAHADFFLDFTGGRHSSIEDIFLPHETKVFSITELLGTLNESPSTVPEGGITIIQRDLAPTLIAQGKITDATTGFSTTMNFLNPALQRLSVLHASGVPIGTPPKGSAFHGAGTFVPHILLRNMTGSPQMATITIEYPRGDGWDSTTGPRNADLQVDASGKDENPDLKVGATTGHFTLAPLTVGPYSTADFSLDSVMAQLPLPLPHCSIKIEYSGRPGSVAAEVSSIELKSDLVIDSRLANEGDGYAGSGVHPWHIDNETESVLFLTNMSNKQARIGFHVQAEGVHYFLTKLKLDGHETRAIDLRKLRDAQEPDFKGNNIPPGASDGSVMWTRIENVPVMGRLVVMQRHKGIASNYDCGTGCSCSPNYVACDITPGPPSCIEPHAIMQATCIATFQDCNLVQTFLDITSAATWTTDVTSVATFDSTTRGLLLAHAAGSANMTATYSDFHYRYSGTLQECLETSVQHGYSSPISVCNINVPDHIHVTDDRFTLTSCGSYRNIYIEVVDYTGAVVSNQPTSEEYYSPNHPVSTCNQGSPPPTGCGYPGQIFPDTLNASCNTTGAQEPCGFTVTLYWRWCPSGQAPVRLGRFDDDVKDSYITANGSVAPGLKGTDVCAANPCAP